MSDGWDRSTVDMPVGAEWPTSDRSGSPRAHPTTPAQLGRYEVVEPIAGGGMGFVYAAYDPELDRNVALKVVHPRRSHNPASHSRLIKEARALARLDHPNVVKVHDVFSHDEQIVVVMELVEGVTLEQWEAEKRRTWREVIDVYVQAGHGLAAAHALEIVHRDFKPANAIVGKDGRVRVLDFGLALIAAEESNPETAASSGAVTRTIPGAIMGTLMYAAPEQLAAGTVVPASDQFSFCVSLYRALEGARPFAGETASELLGAIQDQPPRAGERDVPKWLRAIVVRGLQAVPARRHASMIALLNELERPRGWKKWRWTGLVASAVALAGVTTSSMRGSAAAAVGCDGGDAAHVWDPATRLSVSLAIQRTATAYAREVSQHVIARMDARGSSLQTSERTACLAHRRGATTVHMFEREMSCLAQKLGEFKSAVGVLSQTDSTSLANAEEVVAGLRDSNECLDFSRLLDAPLPAPEVRPQVARVTQDIANAAALRRAGRAPEAERVIRAAIAKASASGYQPAVAEAQLELGRVLIAMDALPRSIATLRSAMQTALANNLPSLAVEAIARRIYAEALTSPDLERTSRDLDFAEALSRTIVGDHFARALLLNNVGAAYSAALDLDTAMSYYAQARQMIAADPDPDIELSSIDLNIGTASHDAGARRAALDNVVKRRALILGDHHPQTLIARFFSASYGDDPRVTLVPLEQACSDLRTFQPALLTMYLSCEREVAVFAEEAGDAKRRLLALQQVVHVGRDVQDVSGWVALCAAELELANGRLEAAAHDLEAIAASRTDAKDWWDRADAAEAKLYLARIAITAGETSSGARLAKESLEAFETIARANLALTYRLRVQQAKTLLRH